MRNSKNIIQINFSHTPKRKWNKPVLKVLPINKTKSSADLGYDNSSLGS